MHTNRMMVGIALALGLALVTSQADADGTPFRATQAGTFLTTRIDLNNDGVLASWGTGVSNSNLGQATAQSVVERALVPPTGACPEGQLELQLVEGRGVSTNVGSGDQLFSEFTSSTLCLNPTTGRFRGNDKGVFTGGTGKNAGATGSFEATVTGSTLLFDPDPAANQAFGDFTAKITGTLTRPDGDATSDAEE